LPKIGTESTDGYSMTEITTELFMRHRRCRTRQNWSGSAVFLRGGFH
jgi:hypothetical protein